MIDSDVRELVRMSLALHNLNRDAEVRFGLSMVQYHVLATLRDMPACSPQRLAEAAGMHPSTLTQSIKRLKRKDALYVADDPKDSRKKILSITGNGNELLEGFLEGIKTLVSDKSSLRSARRLQEPFIA